MTAGSRDAGTLQSHVRHLRYAVATTTCHATADVLKRMLTEAERRLRTQDAVAERV